jgi:elongation factor G
MAVTPESRTDRDNLQKALIRLAEEDPTFTVSSNEETGDVVISGMGELHLEIIVDRLKREFNVNTQVGKPQVAYRETVVGSVDHEYKHVKQTGGHGQYAHVKMHVEPAEPGSGLHFKNSVVGGRIPREYIPAVERGVVDAMAEGPYAGFPMVDLRVELLDGSYHEVDSSEMAFRTCGSIGFREACKKAGLELLEPVMCVEVTAAEEHTGSVTGSLCGKRGRVMNMESRGKTSVITARVPLAEMFGYSSELRNMTSGRGEFTMHFEHYEAVPYSIAEEIVETRRKSR